LRKYIEGSREVGQERPQNCHHVQRAASCKHSMGMRSMAMCTHGPGPKWFSPKTKMRRPKTFPFEMRHSLGTSREAVQSFAKLENSFLPLNPAQLRPLRIPALLACAYFGTLRNLLEAAEGKLLMWADSVSQQSRRLVKKIVHLSGPLFSFPCLIAFPTVTV
jgi:hypothetical protein